MTSIRLFVKHHGVTTLGPGIRSGIWVQGCSLHCRGCIVPESWSPGGGEEESVDSLAEWYLAEPSSDGLTLSGGEPMGQADALVELVDRVRFSRPTTVVCFTGYTLEELQGRGTDAQRALLQRVDLLVDGPYIESSHASARWRGSTNQRLVPLSTEAIEWMPAGPAGDQSAGLQVGLDSDRRPWFTGIPSRPGFRRQWEASLAARGVLIRPDGGDR